MKRFSALLTGLLFLCVSVSARPRHYLIEAESFADRGGWSVDHQAFPKIGSSYLLAHGAGVPVADASTEVDVSGTGDFHIYVCTYNWTSPWYDGPGPGAFSLQINGENIGDRIGVDGRRWEWQYLGQHRLSGKTTLTLHDLTGFDGRIDAIYLTEKKEEMPQTYEEMLRFRAEHRTSSGTVRVEKADLVIVGSGVFGCTAALAAARQGLDVVLVDNLPRLGGNNYLGVKFSGLMNYNKYPQLGNVVRELCGISNEAYHADPGKMQLERENHTGFAYMDRDAERVAALREKLLSEAGVRIYHNIHVYRAARHGKTVTSVSGKHLLTNDEYQFRGTLFADCTGDGEIGYLLGADYMFGREAFSFAQEPSAPEKADFHMMGGTLSWNSTEEKRPSSFPDVSELPWAMQCSEQYHQKVTRHSWIWETGFQVDNALEAELVRDNMLRAIYGNWAYLKNHEPEFARRRLDVVGHVLQKRESRRLYGDLVLNENDIRNGVEYPDASFTTTWTLDLHFPQADNARNFPGWEWISGCPNHDQSSWIKPYHVPYRVLYSRDFDNLFIGGRCMSVTHVALGTVRVQATLGMAAEVTALAAGICCKHKCTPRQVYTRYLDELLAGMEKGF